MHGSNQHIMVLNDKPPQTSLNIASPDIIPPYLLEAGKATTYAKKLKYDPNDTQFTSVL